MPNTKSSEKRTRQNATRRGRNRTQRSALRTQVKKMRQLIEGKSGEQLTTELVTTQSAVDKAAAAGKIHKNKAARIKARLAAAATRATAK